MTLVVILITSSCGGNPGQPNQVTPSPGYQPVPRSTSRAIPTFTENSTTLEGEPAASAGTPEIQPNPSPSASPTQTATISTPFVPVLGGADKIAFFERDEVWVTNLDGGSLVQLTEDGAQKSSLSWSPDGEQVLFTSGLCINSVSLQAQESEIVACFKSALHLDSFQVSPDGSQAAISLDGELFVVPYDRAQLLDASSGEDLAALATCTSLAPYKHRQSLVLVHRAYWSDDGKRLAILREGSEQGEKVDLVQVLDISRCISPLPRLDEFPATRFEMENYAEHPVIQDLAWDGSDLFALTDFKRNDGFGDLWIYSSDLHRGYKANPIDGNCCYRDPAFSPDGKYLAFAYLDANAGPDGGIVLYYLPVAALDTSLTLPPISIPREFFSDPRSKPQPALRPAAED